LYTKILPVTLCPKSASPVLQCAPSQCLGSGEPESEKSGIAEFDEAEKCLDEAFKRRTEDIKEAESAFESQSTTANGKFQQIVAELILPSGTSSKILVDDCSGRGHKFKSRIICVVWELLDNPSSTVILQKDSVEKFSLKLKAAATYEEDVGDVSDTVYTWPRCSLLISMYSPL